MKNVLEREVDERQYVKELMGWGAGLAANRARNNSKLK